MGTRRGKRKITNPENVGQIRKEGALSADVVALKEKKAEAVSVVAVLRTQEGENFM